MVNAISDYLVQSRDTIHAAIDDDALFCAAVRDIAEIVAEALSAGGKLLLAGNNGSAADSQHLAAELVDRLNYERAPVAAIALTTDSSVLIALANDCGYDRGFERQIHALGRPGDVFIAILTSGRSPNILRALAAAPEAGLTTAGLTGKSACEMAALCDVRLRTPLIQQIHITAGHIICELVEERLFSRAKLYE
jgi:D-sedoheptulose 7-phosphate isomerase